MAANLTPQYLKAEEQYRRAQTLTEELQWLEVMFRELPKHKASEKMQMDLKTRISKLKKEIETQKSKPVKVPGVHIPRQGCGTVIVIGGPNAGKSSLLAAITRAKPEIAPYPYTTREPAPGMMTWEDVSVQIVDTPPITADHFPSYLNNLIRAADLVLLLVDLGSDDCIDDTQAVLQHFVESKTRLGRQTMLDEEDVGVSYTQTIVVPNKIDLPEAADRLALVHELCPIDLEEFTISIETGTNMAELKERIYRALDVIRVYTKLPNKKEPDMDKPYTMKRGGTLLDVAELVHKDVAENLKHARIWGSNIIPASTIKGDYVLSDKDIVEIHVNT
jgi:uncharacterized protein